MSLLETDLLKLLRDVTVWCAETLDVERPVIRWAEPTVFRTPTTVAALSDDGTEIALNSTVKDFRFLCFAVAHEMRHLWQMKHKAAWMASYKPSDEAGGITEYNEQDAEIDANAFALIVLTDLLGQRPTLEQQLGSETWAKIRERADEIARELKEKEGR